MEEQVEKSKKTPQNYVVEAHITSWTNGALSVETHIRSNISKILTRSFRLIEKLELGEGLCLKII